MCCTVEVATSSKLQLPHDRTQHARDMKSVGGRMLAASCGISESCWCDILEDKSGKHVHEFTTCTEIGQ